jgi:hypothetical protein
MVGRWEL